MIPKISYTVPEAAEMTGVSASALRAANRAGDLDFHYPTSHPVVLHDDLMAWVASAPTSIRRTA